MVDYREIIRLKSLRFSNVAIADSLRCSRNTVSEVLYIEKHIPCNDQFQMHLPTVTLSTCFIWIGAIMKSGNSRIMNTFIMNWQRSV